MEKITDFCDKLINNPEVLSKPDLIQVKSSSASSSTSSSASSSSSSSASSTPSIPLVPQKKEPIVYKTMTKLDLTTLLNFVRIWTDTLDIDYVRKVLQKSLNLKPWRTSRQLITYIMQVSFTSRSIQMFLFWNFLG